MRVFWRLLLAFFVFLNSTVQAELPSMTYVVETAVIKPEEKFLITRRYIATIGAEKFSLLTPKSSGTVASINVMAGQRVKRNQLLVSLRGTVEKRSLELAEKNLRLAEAELNRSRELFRSHDIKKSELESSERAVITAKSRLEEQRRSVENVEIRAPFDGVVGVPRVALGQSVLPTDTIISIMDGPYSITINIPGPRLAEVKVGQPVSLKGAKSTISAVEMSIDPKTKTGFAKAIFHTCDSCIIGDSAYATITVHEKPKAILINRNAIYYQSGKPYVVVVKKAEEGKSTADIREVGVGEEYEGKVEIVSGLAAGDEIVIANPKRIPMGAQVSVLK